jgi:hypothetical protein
VVGDTAGQQTRVSLHHPYITEETKRGQAGDMPTNKELLESLRDGFANLGYRDEDELNRLDNRGRMYIRRVFGENSEYYQQFVHIGFHALVSPSDAQYEREMWISGQSQTVNLLNTALEELALNAAASEIGRDSHVLVR